MKKAIELHGLRHNNDKLLALLFRQLKTANIEPMFAVTADSDNTALFDYCKDLTAEDINDLAKFPVAKFALLYEEDETSALINGIGLVMPWELFAQSYSMPMPMAANNDEEKILVAFVSGMNLNDSTACYGLVAIGQNEAMAVDIISGGSSQLTEIAWDNLDTNLKEQTAQKVIDIKEVMTTNEIKSVVDTVYGIVGNPYIKHKNKNELVRFRYTASNGLVVDNIPLLSFSTTSFVTGPFMLPYREPDEKEKIVSLWFHSSGTMNVYERLPQINRTATQSKNGLMSATDKQHIDTLWSNKTQNWNIGVNQGGWHEASESDFLNKARLGDIIALQGTSNNISFSLTNMVSLGQITGIDGSKGYNELIGFVFVPYKPDKLSDRIKYKLCNVAFRSAQIFECEILHDEATTTKAGLMSAKDKATVDKYTDEFTFCFSETDAPIAAGVGILYINGIRPDSENSLLYDKLYKHIQNTVERPEDSEVGDYRPYIKLILTDQRFTKYPIIAHPTNYTGDDSGRMYLGFYVFVNHRPAFFEVIMTPEIEGCSVIMVG